MRAFLRLVRVLGGFPRASSSALAKSFCCCARSQSSFSVTQTRSFKSFSSSLRRHPATSGSSSNSSSPASAFSLTSFVMWSCASSFARSLARTRTSWLSLWANSLKTVSQSWTVSSISFSSSLSISSSSLGIITGGYFSMGGFVSSWEG
jgi:hypothetical protein